MALDNFRAQKIIWDRANKKIFEAIEASSGDSNGRKLVVQVINQETTENLSGMTLSLAWKSRNGAKGLDAFKVVDASKGIFEIYYPTGMLSNIGNLEASLILINSTGRIESSTFTISVRPSTVDDESVESENSFTALTKALIKVNDFDARLAQKAEQRALEVEKERINNLISLPEGSTTNDARLEDIRIGYDGTVYDSPGEAVRQQIVASMGVIIDNRVHRTNAVAVNISYDINQLDLSGAKIQVKFDTKIVGGTGSKFTIRHSDSNYKTIGEEYQSSVMESSSGGTSHVFTLDIADDIIEKSKFFTVTTNGASGTDKVDLEITNIEIRTVGLRINTDLKALGDMNGLYERIYPVSKNLFNHNQLIFGGRLDRISGGILDSEVSCYTEYIPVKENAVYTISEQGIPYSAVSYDSNYNRLEGYLLGGTWGDTTINTPMRTSFLRYSFASNVDYEKIMLNEGNEILPFEEYQDQGNHDETVAGAFNYLLDNTQENGGGDVEEVGVGVVVISSEQTKPIISEMGEALLEYDTGKVFFYDGTDWIEWSEFI